MSATRADDGRRRLAEVTSEGTRIAAVRLSDGREARLEGLDGARPGDLVLVEAGHDGYRAIPGVVAAAGTVRARMLRLAAAHGVEPPHPPAALAEASAAASNQDLEAPGLADLTSVPFVTVDPADSRDLDQALHLERDGSATILRYALADAARVVRPRTALFAEALARGASFYLPGIGLPMLPPSLSEGSLSLLPRGLRRALVFELRLDRAGAAVAVRMLWARVRSRAKLSYRRVQRFYDDPAGSGWLDRPWRASLELLAEVGRLRLDDSRRRHVVRPHRDELMLAPDASDPSRLRATVRDRLPVESFNEQVSVLVNVEGARILVEAHGRERVEPIFKVHPAPARAELDRLATRLAALASARGLDPGVWTWRRDAEPLADYLARLPRRGRSARIARAVDRQAVLVNRPAVFSAEPGPHAGLGAPAYARFTAPMREIVGVFTHKEALELIGGSGPATAGDLALRDAVVAAGNRARELQKTLERAADRIALDTELTRRESGGEPLTGTVMGMTADRLHVRLDEPPLDVKVYLKDLEAADGRRWRVDPLEVEASCDGGATVLLGDRLRIGVAGLDPTRDRWRFCLIAG
jgi:ribonuclease R